MGYTLVSVSMAIERIVRALGLIAATGEFGVCDCAECEWMYYSVSTLTFYLLGSLTHLALSLSAQECYQWVLLVSYVTTIR